MSVETRGRHVDLNDCKVMHQKEQLAVLDQAYDRLSKVVDLYRTQGVVNIPLRWVKTDV
ncbi:MAG: hypothetical protein ABW105_14535 [Candidatus Thiodiazotropha sp. 6PLUC1]